MEICWNPTQPGTLYFDDFESRRLSYIGVLDSPYTPPEPSVAPAYLASVYDYGDPLQPGNPQPNQPHAVKSVDHPTGTPDASYTYDNNGNMIERVENTQTWILSYNEENRLEKVEKVSGTCSVPGTTSESWTSTYDGNGMRVKQAHYISGIGTTTTHYYAGGSYEIQDVGGGGEKVIRYYGFGGKRIAMLDDAGEISETLQYFLTDQQGSTIAVLSDTGTVISEQRYKPFGEVRDDVGTITETDFGYTGQRNISAAKLMDYNARFFSPELGRFTQPDTIIPSLFNPQSLNRYAYVSNNPIRFIDPTGHEGECRDHDIECGTEEDRKERFEKMLAKYGVVLDGKASWSSQEMYYILQAVIRVAHAFARALGGDYSPVSAFKAVFGLTASRSFTFSKCGDETKSCDGAWRAVTTSSNQIVVNPSKWYKGVNYVMKNTRMLVHEFGHAFNSRLCDVQGPDDACYNTSSKYGAYNDMQGNNLSRPSYEQKDEYGNVTGYWGFAGGQADWQFTVTNYTDSGEIWADMFLGWVYGKWGDNYMGRHRRDYMNDAMGNAEEGYLSIVISAP
ncbi:MAG: RHS repeat-associated core domain-containing protein [Anaerolineae bacterium]|nr:RHS repeat-associated core domain-containing protein [Anaerolineae bacterium]